MTGARKPLRGRRPGDRRVRVERPYAQLFRYSAANVLTARPAASAPATPTGRAMARIRAIVFGKPLASDEEIEQRLPKKKALAIFSSDAISSSAYATEEILLILVAAGASALFLSLEIAIAIAILLAVVSTSYRQIGQAYPNGGGAYAVSRANLGKGAALIAAGALLVDYVLTVAVSISSAAQQLYSAVPALEPVAIELGVLFIVLMSIGNLRGLRESGNIFAIPTYLFVGSALLMIGLGTWRVLFEGAGAPPPQPLPSADGPLQAVTILLVLRAFASGSVALTGTEAIANGVPAFKPPEPRNAATTLTLMAVLLGVLFVGITFVADSFGIVPMEGQTVVAQVAAVVYGDGSLGFYLFQAFTALILVLAANTSYNAFPRLAAILAEDDFMPRPFAFRGDRLAYTFGILLLGGAAIGLIVGFRGDTHALIPLYSVGVFVSFTLSQSGMVRHWLKERSQGWRRRLGINAIGGLMTGIVLVVVLIGKAPASLLVAVIIPVLVGVMLFIEAQYRHAREQLAVRRELVFPPPSRHQRVVIPVSALTRDVVQAVQFARSISDDVRSVHVSDDLQAAELLRVEFERQFPGVPFVIVESPYRSLVRPFVRYLDYMDTDAKALTLVVIPEYVAQHWWERTLYSQTSARLRRELLGRPDTVVADLPYRRDGGPMALANGMGSDHPDDRRAS